MGIEIKTTEVITCDICKSSCGKDDGKITIKVNNGDGRDVGPATIDGQLTFTQPYGVSRGIVCRECKINWLTKYLERIDT